ncbi:FAD/NAD(P)-binding domain-containing protein [Xylariaceae sp. FL1651]|nr:FAD/NAD(P)-binding domain-containing protein [Xylariaceae sp. FL1651]
MPSIKGCDHLTSTFMSIRLAYVIARRTPPNEHNFDDCKPVCSYPLISIDVLIVGTGLSGLTPSIECIRKGYNVRVLERDRDINTAGLLSLHNDERMIPVMKVSDRVRAVGQDPNTPSGAFQMRPLIYKIFIHQLEKLGVEIQFGKRVVEYYNDEAREKASVVTDQGELGGQVRAMSSGRAMWRAAFLSHHPDENPEVKEFFEMAGEQKSEPVIRSFLGPGTYELALARPGTCIWIMNHNMRLIQGYTFSITNSSKVTESEKENWINTVKCEKMLNNMDKGCSPGGRVVQIGDAAHSFLPASGNSATQAIEDAVSLASCLQIGSKENLVLSNLGFSSAEIHQDTDWSKANMAETVKQGIPFDQVDSVPPNYPLGHRYQPWSIEQIMEDMRGGKPVNLGDGVWD